MKQNKTKRNVRFVYGRFLPVFISLSLSIQLTAQNNTQSIKDSLRNVIPALEGKDKTATYIRLGNLYFAESKDPLKMDTMIAIYAETDKEAESQGDDDIRGILKVNLFGAYNNSKLYDKLLEETPKTLQFLEQKKLWKYYALVSRKIIEAYEATGKFGKAVNTASELYEKMKSEQHKTGMAIALYTTAMLHKDSDENKINDLRECISLLDGDEKMLPVTANIWFDLCQTLLSGKRYEETLKAAEDFEKTNIAYDAYARITVATSWANLWGVYARLYTNTNEYDKAEVYCNKIDSIIDNPTYQIMVLDERAKILNVRKQYEEALKLIDHSLELNSFYAASSNGSRKTKIEVLKNMNRWQEAFETLQDFQIVRDSVRQIDLIKQVDIIHTEYEIARINAEKNKAHNNFLFALGGCVLLAITLGGWIFYSRQIKRKNRVLARQIREISVWQEKEENEILSYETASSSKIAKQDTATSCIYKEERNDVLCTTLRNILLREKGYLDPNLSRDGLIEQLGTNKRLFTEAFQHCFGTSFIEYVNQLRLKEAIRLLEQTSLPVEEISDKSGFGTSRTFHRQFQAIYNITPKAYRKSITEKE